jgi:hypothetical protein
MEIRFGEIVQDQGDDFESLQGQLSSTREE